MVFVVKQVNVYGKLESTVQLVILTLISLTFLGGRNAEI